MLSNCLLRLYLVIIVGFLVAPRVHAQGRETYDIQALVLDHDDHPLAGVNVRVEGTTIGSITDSEGRVTVSRIPAGEATLIFSFVGFESVELELIFPRTDGGAELIVVLEEAHDEMEEIAVTATRTSRTIADQATRIETIAGEEIDEKISMEPSNISMLLNESPGIMVQQTSSVSGGASIRIQGLDGRYTQILKDGFPLYGGFSGGLSLLQIPPLDLLQVEVIKGPTSTLYGGDAIAGLVNLVSKGPTEDSELSMLVNATSASGFDAGGFYSGTRGKVGLTVLAAANFQQPYDPDNDALSNLPDTRRITLNPKLFLYLSDHTTLSLGVSGALEQRDGGAMSALEGGYSFRSSDQSSLADDRYTENNESTRMTSQFRLDHLPGLALQKVFGEGGLITLKNSVSLFDRSIETSDTQFSGRQVATYSEASALLEKGDHELSIGLDIRSDAFSEDSKRASVRRDYTYSSVGFFVQDTWDATDRVVVEAGMRADRHNVFGSFLLPKASVLYRFSSSLSARFGGGLGYKAPTIFLEPSEAVAFQGVLPISTSLDAETSRGGSVDVNYRTLLFDRVAVSINQAFYFTHLRNPVLPETSDLSGVDGLRLMYRNADGPMRTRAHETNAKLSLGHLKLFLGYVNLTAEQDVEGERVAFTLTPRHKTYSVLVFEKHGVGRIGLEGYRTGKQTLEDGSSTDSFWILGIMTERRVQRARVFVNFENILDTKQSNYAPVVSGTLRDPVFEDVWAPMDGFVVNGGVKYSF